MISNGLLLFFVLNVYLEIFSTQFIQLYGTSIQNVNKQIENIPKQTNFLEIYLNQNLFNGSVNIEKFVYPYLNLGLYESSGFVISRAPIAMMSNSSVIQNAIFGSKIEFYDKFGRKINSSSSDEVLLAFHELKTFEKQKN